ncbi:hypothetical protein [Nocardia sp. NPDC056000]|uniref:hypothetical protein n=1 Tax=Nocardia sp. NPDC056000 TaxID=3345674 RepID=UPI0035E27907
MASRKAYLTGKLLPNGQVQVQYEDGTIGSILLHGKRVQYLNKDPGFGPTRYIASFEDGSDDVVVYELEVED